MSRGRRGRLRIIGGRWRGRPLTVAPVPGLRPTPDRVRETLFNWLAPELPGARCLDLFAGTGALGLEALSRGAAEAVLVERDARLVRLLQEKVAELEAPARVVQAEVGAYLNGAAESFHIVFMDPPYASGRLAEYCRRLADGGWAAPGARVYVECDAGEAVPDLPDAAWPAGWGVLRRGRAGRAAFALLEVPEAY